MQQSYPLICAGVKCTENTTGLHWNGEFALRDDRLLRDGDFDHHLNDDGHLESVFNGTYDDEFSIHFFWTEPPRFRMQEYWAEAWYDYETKDFHCCVREVMHENVRVYGPNPKQMYYKPEPKKTLTDLADMINPWNHLTDNGSTFNIDAERAKSREYKDWLKQTEMKTALAVALHERLGDLLVEIVMLI